MIIEMRESNLVQNITELKKLPNTWVVKDFKDIVADNSGGNKKLAKTDFLELGEIAVVDQGKELIAGFYNDLKFAVKTKPPYVVFGDHTRIFKYIDFPFVMGADGTKVLQPADNNCNTKYLYYFFLSINVPETGYNRHFKYLKDLQIPLPPLPTQQKIASILDAADTLIQKDKALLAKYDELTQSLFLDMFGDPLSNNLNFPFPKIKDFTTVSQGMQIAIKERHKKNGVNRYKYLTVAYLNGRKEEEYIENPRLSVVCNKEEILMIRTGNTGQVVTNVEGVFHNNFFKIDWNRDKLNKIYLVYFLSNPVIRRNLLKRASTTTIPDLSHGQFYDLNIIVPLLSLQTQFAERVTKIEQQKAIAQASLEKSEELFNSLLQKAFKGELM